MLVGGLAFCRAIILITIGNIIDGRMYLGGIYGNINILRNK